MEEEFEMLAAKVLANEASIEERSRFQEILSQNAVLRKEFAELEATWRALRAAGPLAQALGTNPIPIPAEQLRRLQEVVRERMPKSAAKPVQPSLSRTRTAPLSGVALLWQWLLGGTRVSPVLISCGLLVLMGGAFLLVNRLGKSVDSTSHQTAPAAYLLAGHGMPEVKRNGKPLPVNAVRTLRAGDEIYLPTGSEATLIASNAIVVLRGPQRFSTRRLPMNPGATWATNVGSTISRSVLFMPTRELLAAGLLVTTRSAPGIPLYSPLGSTADLTPLILWKADPGKTYDLLISDEFNPKARPLGLRGVVPPVEFAKVEAWKARALNEEGLYRVRLTESGNSVTACEYTFRTLKEAEDLLSADPAGKLLNSFRLVTSNSSHVGDALADLMTLSAEPADSEFALRLKLLAFGQLGYKDDFDNVAAQLQTVR